ncbi:isocitrate lyase/PEP mutase family protein [Tenuibacillus multivorans]|uniref:2-Methylisocitrate lyase, PEP mutase family n=1 Tax=Tenuibacillus multivorans TaxID=237069 RepID=A0A1H0BNF4_9BACI|nr:isocitrate lyase/PEP mutase family protein [Tenuibacillus multivorans]GEL77100.1 carboxyvinyl-carboxyphosphonate phosphorylmutase [Tenuibacillus multivorans]SDN47102.1 2-Methylisocitrate lyase, PEP mutase family [Tenuibacillus multivorans]
MKRTTKFRELLNQDGIIITPGGYDAMSAKIIEETGFDLMLATGAGISNSQLGIADVGLTSMHEVMASVDHMAQATNIPIIADVDTGFGNAINLIRTVKEFEKIGAAGIQIEDQVSPKKCGHFTGKQVISKEEMVLKVKAAVDAREDDDFIIVARTDARAIYDLDEAISRAKAYAEAGADVTFVEAPQTKEELQRIATELEGIPQMANMVEGGLTPLLSAQELEEMGFKIMICANTALRAAVKNIRSAMQTLYSEKSHKNVHDLICTWEERQNLFELDRVKGLEKTYLELEGDE